MIHFNAFTLLIFSLSLHNIFPNVNIYTICKYFTELSFNATVIEKGIRSDHNFSLLHINARSLPHNFRLLTNYLECLDLVFNFVGVTETWLSNSNYDLYSQTDSEHLNQVDNVVMI